MYKYCFDLDGTLCTKYSDNYNEAEPIMDRVRVVNSLYEQGHFIHIETARGTVTGIDWEEVTRNQLKAWGLKYHTLRAGVKYDADFYVDDKGINDNHFFNKIK